MPEPPARVSAVSGWTPVAIALGCASLAARSSPGVAALLATVVAGALGALVPVPVEAGLRPFRMRWLGALGLGIAALAIGRLLRAPLPATPVTAFAVWANVLAAVCEELFFRRLMYAWCVRWGPALAVATTAAAFALVHVPAYGILVLPVDAAAGVLFSWQRWASGSWSVPAITHALGNLL